MKIAMVVGWEYDTPPLRYGGVELVVSDLAEALVQRGHDVFLLAPGTSHTAATLVPYIAASVDRTFADKASFAPWAAQVQLDCLAAIRRRLEQIQPDIIHSHLGALLLPFQPDVACLIVTTEHWELTEQIDVENRRGATPELIRHGVNGLLVDDAEARFTSGTMAERYEAVYRRAIDAAAR